MKTSPVVVVGEIVAAEKHPNADKLQVCQVNIGAAAPLQIVCGAPNARVGLKAPLATVGAILPNGMTIKAAALRGVDSQGMLCSAKELALSDESNGLFELPRDARVGQALSDYLGLPDAMVEIKLTANRPDCLGIRGLAQDVAALYGMPLQREEITAVAPTSQATRTVQLDAGADCPRYLGRVIEGIDMSAATPLWMTERLRRSGVRAISAVVDVTNYVMLELGQPLHAFDHVRVQGTVVVRPARAGEPLTLLDGSERTLDEGFLVIADEQRALALARRDGRFRIARHRCHTKYISGKCALCTSGHHGPRAQTRPAYRCLAPLRARRRSRAAAPGAGTRRFVADQHRRRPGRAGHRSGAGAIPAEAQCRHAAPQSPGAGCWACI